MTLGLVIGKFYPPHRGHRKLIEAARQQCDHLIVIVAHHSSHKIPGELRRAWMQEMHTNCDVRLVPDELEDDSEQWALWTLDYLGRAPDVVFTSEDYGPVYASLMGSRHVMIDRHRVEVPISGTMIRNDPLASWDYLDPVVRTYFIRRVVIVGAESTGKTTLARNLAAHFQTVWVPEYGRDYWETKAQDWQQTAPTWTSAEFEHIAAEQQRRENESVRNANRVLICDTNAFATGIWHERYLQHRNLAVDAIGKRDQVDLYLLTDIDAPFVQDGWRDGRIIRQWMHDAFLKQLQESKSRFKVVSGSWEHRNQQSIEAVELLLKEQVRLQR